MTEKLVIGMMSGTSADGIDAVLARFNSPHEVEILTTHYEDYPLAVRNQVNEITHTQEIVSCRDTPLNDQLASLYANACLELITQSGVDKKEISALANHGQTVRHEPNANPPYSLQLGNPQLIANQTGLLTVANFRQADLAAGGQGAPLMPAFHSAVFNDNKQGKSGRFLLNIGGIANITHLGDTVIGFDTGPGNTLLDQWIYKHKQLTYDKSGAWAASGQVNKELLGRLVLDPYFSKPFPKSTGPDYFNLSWLNSHLNSETAEDVQATLLELTVISVANELKQVGDLGGDIFVCGGGAHNKLLMKRLQESLPSYQVLTTDSLGIPADWVEATGFAWLGYCRLLERNSNLPSVTGATDAVSLGEVFFPE